MQSLIHNLTSRLMLFLCMQSVFLAMVLGIQISQTCGRSDAELMQPGLHDSKKEIKL